MLFAELAASFISELAASVAIFIDSPFELCIWQVQRQVFADVPGVGSPVT